MKKNGPSNIHTTHKIHKAKSKMQHMNNYLD